MGKKWAEGLHLAGDQSLLLRCWVSLVPLESTLEESSLNLREP